jgi:hypothetical protein
MAKFEKSVKVRTPDGVEHDSMAAANAHMAQQNFVILGNASEIDFRALVDGGGHDAIRSALRDVYLQAFPRATKGRPRGPRKAKDAASDLSAPTAAELAAASAAAEHDMDEDGEPETVVEEPIKHHRKARG